MRVKKPFIFIALSLTLTIVIPEILFRVLSIENFIIVIESLNFLSAPLLLAPLYEALLVSLILSYIIMKIYYIVRNNKK